MQSTDPLTAARRTYGEMVARANELVAAHGLDEKGWRVEWDDSIRRAGQCRHNKREIGLAFTLMKAWPAAEFDDTVLHEIAHALVGPGNGHNDVWKRKCVEIGARPTRCYEGGLPRNEDAGPPRWSATCGSCGKVYSRERVRKGPRYFCRPCDRTLVWFNNYNEGEARA